MVLKSRDGLGFSLAKSYVTARLVAQLTAWNNLRATCKTLTEVRQKGQQWAGSYNPKLDGSSSPGTKRGVLFTLIFVPSSQGGLGPAGGYNLALPFDQEEREQRFFLR